MKYYAYVVWHRLTCRVCHPQALFAHHASQRGSGLGTAILVFLLAYLIIAIFGAIAGLYFY